MIIALVWLGLYPQPMLDVVQPVVDSLLANQHFIGDASMGVTP